MKRLAILLSAFALVGAGCLGTNVPAPFEGAAYENAEFGFAFDYPSNMEVRDRDEANRMRDYLGREMDHFASLRDTVRGDKPENIAYFYAVPDLTVADFLSALEGSPGVTEVKGTEETKVGGINVTKVTNATEFGTDKVHHLFERGGSTIIVSVFIGEEGEFDPLFQTLRKF